MIKQELQNVMKLLWDRLQYREQFTNREQFHDRPTGNSLQHQCTNREQFHDGVYSLNKAKQSKKAVLVSCNGPFYKQKGYNSLISGGNAT
jgi:hypothetical protein